MVLRIQFLLTAFLLVVLFFVACTKDPSLQLDPSEAELLAEKLNLPNEAFNYSDPDLPPFFKGQFVKIQDNTPSTNQIDNWAATLGRVLFYDKNLSINKTIACASCHIQEFGFTDTAILSKGFAGGLTKRHSMSLINARYYNNGRFFWDERAATLEDQVLQPIQDGLEMGMTIPLVIERLQAEKHYPILFKYAFGTNEISEKRIANSLAQFVRSIVSFQSKYDVGRAMVNKVDEDFPNFSQQENLGKTIFFSHNKVPCAGCHTSDVFVLDNPRNNGLTFDNPDDGIFVHTAKAGDKGKFKVSSLKNVEMRVNYMHNGSLRGLEAVVFHYNSDIKPNPNLDNHLFDPVTGSPLSMQMDEIEVSALLAFLKTLNDYEIVKDVKFSSPFK